MSRETSPQLIGKARQLKVRQCPDLLHKKIEKFMRKQNSKRNIDLTKEDATIELLEKATSKITLDN